jgi:outer membrane biosynthesis protein TonB
VRRIVPLFGRPEFTRVAVDAIRQWTFSPPVENGEPVEAIETIEVELHGM